MKVLGKNSLSLCENTLQCLVLVTVHSCSDVCSYMSQRGA